MADSQPSDSAELEAAVSRAKQQWPRLAAWNVKLSKGQGEGWSETYPPNEEGNPTPSEEHRQSYELGKLLNSGVTGN